MLDIFWEEKLNHSNKKITFLNFLFDAVFPPNAVMFRNDPELQPTTVSQLTLYFPNWNFTLSLIFIMTHIIYYIASFHLTCC